MEGEQTLGLTGSNATSPSYIWVHKEPTRQTHVWLTLQKRNTSRFKIQFGSTLTFHGLAQDQWQ